MLKWRQISLLKSLFRHPFQSSPKPISYFPTNSVSSIPAHQLTPDAVPFTKLSFQLCPASSFQHPKTFFSTESGAETGVVLDYNKELEAIHSKFAEAREEIEMAMESKETVYFNEEAECARAAVNEVLDMFEGLLGKLPESEKKAVQRSMGLKMEQLKAELRQLEDE